jgi:hypothetical protein
LLKVKFGLQMHLAEARFDQVRRKNTVRIVCRRPATDAISKLEDGTEAAVAIAEQ